MVARMIDEFWAEYFGCSAADLSEPKTLVIPHAAPRGYEGVLAFRRGPSHIVSIPHTVPEIARERLREAPPHRRKGHARAAAGACMKHAFDRGLVAMWRTLTSNKAGIALGRSLGFYPYASTIEVQLEASEF